MVEALAQWIAEEYDNKRQLQVDTSGWPRRYERSIPRQQNGWDCGVFALQARAPFCHETLHLLVWFPVNVAAAAAQHIANASLHVGQLSKQQARGH